LCNRFGYIYIPELRIIPNFRNINGIKLLLSREAEGPARRSLGNPAVEQQRRCSMRQGAKSGRLVLEDERSNSGPTTNHVGIGMIEANPLIKKRGFFISISIVTRVEERKS
jgi:hypothetical protein